MADFEDRLWRELASDERLTASPSTSPSPPAPRRRIRRPPALLVGPFAGLAALVLAATRSPRGHSVALIKPSNGKMIAVGHFVVTAVTMWPRTRRCPAVNAYWGCEEGVGVRYLTTSGIGSGTGIWPISRELLWRINEHDNASVEAGEVHEVKVRCGVDALE